jgi:RHS repeat-associated protein
VTDAAASVVQSTQYYPFGTSFADASGISTQPYKYNGKELDARNGLNMHDYGARWKPDWYFTTVDPLAEKYYSISPYAYCNNNPLRFIDPSGKSYTDFGNKDTNETMHVEDGMEQVVIVDNEDYTNIEEIISEQNWTEENTEEYFSIIENGRMDMDSDMGLLIRIGYAEFRGSNSTEQQIGMDITLNRVDDSKYPNTLKGVIKQPYQYSSLNKNDPNKRYFDNPAGTMENQKGKKIESNRNAWLKTISNAISILNGDKRGISQGATMYYSPRSMKPANSTPKWNFNILQEIKVNGVRESHLKLYKSK